MTDAAQFNKLIQDIETLKNYQVPMDIQNHNIINLCNKIITRPYIKEIMKNSNICAEELAVHISETQTQKVLVRGGKIVGIKEKK